LPLGLHFNITEGISLSCGREFPGKDGIWNAERDNPEHWALQTPFVRAELVAQLDRFRSLVGREPSYVDGHNHVHVLPVVAAAMKELLPPRGIRWLRCPEEDLSVAVRDNTLSEPMARLFTRLVDLARTAKETWSDPTDPAQQRLHTSAHFLGLALMGANNSASKLASCIRALQAGVTEYMCHPGHPSTIGDDFSQSPDRQHELDLLTQPTLLQLIKQEGVLLASWADLHVEEDAQRA
jgi:predicted glycoside hydrolase/deacetylase ChbG (UPF0249 family)